MFSSNLISFNYYMGYVYCLHWKFENDYPDTIVINLERSSKWISPVVMQT